jgi:O-antigen ligase
MMLVVSLDFRDFFDKSGSTARYGLLLIPIGVVVLARLRRRSLLLRRWSAPDRLLCILMVWGIVGSLYGKHHDHTTSGALPVFVPMILAFTYLLAETPPTDRECLRILNGISIIGVVYAFMNSLANAGAHFIAAKTYRNSKILYVTMGISASYQLRRRRRLVIMLLLAAFIFATYPSGTDVVVTVVGLATWFFTKPAGSPLRPAVVVTLGTLLLLLAIANFAASTGLAAEYFHAVGKKDNNNARIALYTAAIDQVKASPVYGTSFTGSITELVIRQAGQGAAFKAPFHDDYLMIAANGGLAGLLLFVIWIAATEINVLRRYRGFLTSGEYPKAMLLRSLLVGFNTLFAAALFNPELEAIGRGATVFGIYALMMMIGWPAQQGQGAPRRRGVPAARPLPVAVPNRRAVS